MNDLELDTCPHCRPGELCEVHWRQRVYLVRVRLAELDHRTDTAGEDDRAH